VSSCSHGRVDEKQQVAIPDARLDKLAELAQSKKVVGAQLEFVDIAGPLAPSTN
jgi:ribosome-binding ATPase YchF (GTP1/OBG family)